MQDTPPSRVPPSWPRVLVVGVDCMAQVVPFHRSARGLRFLPLRVVATPVAVHCDRPVQDTPERIAPLKPRRVRGCRSGPAGLIALGPGRLARAQGTNRGGPGWSAGPPRCYGVPAADLAAAAAGRVGGRCRRGSAGPAAIIAPPRTAAVMPAPSAAVAIRVLATRLIPCPAMHSSVGLPPGMTANTSKTPKPARRLAPDAEPGGASGPVSAEVRPGGCPGPGGPGG